MLIKPYDATADNPLSVLNIYNWADYVGALAKATSFDLLRSDVVLPGGSSGPEFARTALVEYPDLKCIFMSGYAPQSTESTKIDKKWKLLPKPFTLENLTSALLDELA